MKSIVSWIIGALVPGWHAAVADDGHAKVSWLASSATCEPGKPLTTAIRMVVAEGWHTYWINPGDGGMKTIVEWHLPAGWKTEGIRYPVPQAFRSGELPGFGYAGTVLFPATLVAPADFKGEAVLKASVSWLACNEGACVPGSRDLTLRVSAGPAADSTDAAAVRAAQLAAPRPAGEQVRLDVKEAGAELELTLHAETGALPGLEQRRGFPATPEVVDSAAVIRFSAADGHWLARVRKSEYAATPVRALTLVLSGAGSAPPVEISWSAR